MKALLIEPVEFTPRVVFDPEKHYFEISGKSRPEDVSGFYEPVLNWLNSYMKEIIESGEAVYSDNKPMEFNFRFEYFNSASSKMIFDILKKIRYFHNEGLPIKINWYYFEDDEDIADSGEELSKLVKLPFNFVETNYEEDDD